MILNAIKKRRSSFFLVDRSHWLLDCCFSCVLSSDWSGYVCSKDALCFCLAMLVTLLIIATICPWEQWPRIRPIMIKSSLFAVYFSLFGAAMWNYFSDPLYFSSCFSSCLHCVTQAVSSVWDDSREMILCCSTSTVKARKAVPVKMEKHSAC